MVSTVLLAASGARALAMMIGLSLLSWWPLVLILGGLALWAWGFRVTRDRAAEPVRIPVPRRPHVLVPRQRGAASLSRNISSGSVNPNAR